MKWESLSEDSVLKFTDGTESKGAEEVTDVILHCCRVYNQAYIDTEKQGFVIGVCGTLVIGGAILGVNNIIKRIKKSKKEILKDEA